MSRRQKLFERIDTLESQFRVLLAEELEDEIKGGFRPYLRDKRRGGTYSSREMLPIELVEQEIVELRQKLEESIDDSWVSVVNEMASRGAAGANDELYSWRRIPKGTSSFILELIRRPAKVSEVKEAIQSLLTSQRGVTAYNFTKEALTKGLSYPIKRKDLDQTLQDSGTDEIYSVSYDRRPLIPARHANERTEARRASDLKEGEILFRASYRVWNSKSNLSLSLYGVPSTETIRLKPHIHKTALPTLRNWLASAKSASHEWRAGSHTLTVGWRLGELEIYDE